jgi:outer membrane protein OmpA-like peptidoglycan-associated protein
MHSRGTLRDVILSFSPGARRLFMTLCFFLLASVAAIGQQSFEFRYVDGDQYRILSTVDQVVRIDGAFSHTATILNRISTRIERTRDGSGYLISDFQTSEEARGAQQVFALDREYRSEFWRDEQGYLDIADHYFMPVVRDVPVFPDRQLEPGDSWSAMGRESHDLREGFGIPEAFTFPIPVTYRYAGKAERNGTEYDLIEINYNVFYQTEQNYVGLYPQRVTGSSDQRLYWDQARGRPHYYEEEYVIIFDLSNGQTVEFSGTASAEVIESRPLDRESVAEEVRRDLDEEGFDGADVSTDERGVTITLDDIQFPPDSAFLRESEQEKLDRIGNILRRYPERDILITGHTALAGTPEGRQRLSEARAAAVGEYLLQTGVRNRDRLIYRGFGARQPVADNGTAEGRRRNRRVEITIMEN